MAGQPRKGDLGQSAEAAAATKLSVPEAPRKAITSRVVQALGSPVVDKEGRPLPTGKYYPSNYEQSQEQSRSRPSVQPSGYRPARSAFQVPTSRPSGKTRKEHQNPESKQRLQQYQREMVAQATLAATRLMGTAGPMKASDPQAPMLASTCGQGGSWTADDPCAPRLDPLGSPGPVTPMELAAGNAREGYLTLGGALTGPNSSRQSEEISEALRMDQDRRRREGHGSPVVSPGPATC
jgi:hypothetical protein